MGDADSLGEWKMLVDDTGDAPKREETELSTDEASNNQLTRFNIAWHLPYRRALCMAA